MIKRACTMTDMATCILQEDIQAKRMSRRDESDLTPPLKASSSWSIWGTTVCYWLGEVCPQGQRAASSHGNSWDPSPSPSATEFNPWSQGWREDMGTTIYTHASALVQWEVGQCLLIPMMQHLTWNGSTSQWEQRQGVEPKQNCCSKTWSTQDDPGKALLPSRLQRPQGGVDLKALAMEVSYHFRKSSCHTWKSRENWLDGQGIPRISWEGGFSL